MLLTTFCGIRLKNPLILASGLWGTSAGTLIRAAREGAGAVTSKSCCLYAREGHRNPTVLSTEHFILNAVGLSNPGAEEELEELKIAVKKCGVPVIASISGERAEEFGEVARIISEAKPAFIEANISCPNVEKEMRMFAADEKDAATVISAVKDATKIPVIAKLSPNVTDIVQIARACEEAGADAINAINTLKGMAIDINARSPILSNKTGGVSGPAIKPLAVRCVYEISRAVEIPIIGTGGILTGEDAIEMLFAGASAVGIGSGIYYREKIFLKIAKEMQEWMRKNGYRKISELKMQE